MQTIQLRLLVSEDSVIHLNIPIDIKCSELEVSVTVEAVKKEIEVLDDEELKGL